MSTLYEIGLELSIHVGETVCPAHVTVTVPAGNPSEAMAMGKQARCELTKPYIKGSVGVQFSVTKPNKDFRFAGVRFQDGDIKSVRFYHDARTISFKTNNSLNGATFGLWAHDLEGYEKQVRYLKDTLGLQ